MSTDKSETFSMHNYLVRREQPRTPQEIARGLSEVSLIANRIIAQVAVKLEFGSSEGGSFPTVTIETSEFDRAGNSLWADLDDACNELMDKRVRFFDPIKESFVSTRWMASAEYTGNGRMICQFAPALMPVLLELSSHRTQIHLPSYMDLDSRHSQRLYELACSFKSLGGWSWTIDQFRNAFGIAPLAYRKGKKGQKLETDPTEWRNFRRRLFNEPIAEINEKTDLELSIEKRNKGRRWDIIYVSVKPQIKRAEGSPKPPRKLEEWEQWCKDQRHITEYRLLWSLLRVCDEEAFKTEFLKVLGAAELPESGSLMRSMKDYDMPSEVVEKYGQQIYNESKQTTFDGF